MIGHTKVEENKLENFIEHLNDAVFRLDRNWNFKYLNDSAAKMLLRKKEDLINKCIWDEFKEAVNSTFSVQYHKAMEEQVTVEFQEFYPPLNTWFDVRAYPTENDLTVHFRDITSSKNELHESKEHFKSLFEHNPDAVYSLDLEGNYLSANNSFVRMFEYTVEEALKMNYFPLINPEDIEHVQNHFHQASKGIPQNYEVKCKTKYGKEIFIHVTNVPIIVNDKIVGVYGISKDITKNKQSETAVRKSEQLYHLITENSQDVIIFTSPEGLIRYVSPAIKTILGYEPDNLLGRKGADLIHPDDATKRKKLESDFDIETMRFLHKKGHYVWIEVSRKVIKKESGEIDKILVMGRDVTKRIEADELMIKSEKLSLAGQLSAGIAHEIRNPLTSIKGFLQMMQNGYELKQEYLDVIYSELTRIESILSELLLLAKPQVLRFENKKLTSIINQVSTLLETETNYKDILLIKELAKDEIWINCDENQMKQVIINLLKNGIESMPNGGELTIKTAIENHEVCIYVIDQGCGISQKEIANLGQPFFTTKEKGTGLGLAVSFHIIENHNGKVLVESEPGKGTIFLIKLPIMQTKP